MPKKSIWAKRTCEFCDKVFMRKKSLETHHRRYHETIYSCENCLKIFEEESDLAKHKIIFHKEAEFQCKKCSRAFQDGKNFDEHCKNCIGSSAAKLSCQSDETFVATSDSKRKGDYVATAAPAIKHAGVSRKNSVRFSDIEATTIEEVELDDDSKRKQKLQTKKS